MSMKSTLTVFLIFAIIVVASGNFYGKRVEQTKVGQGFNAFLHEKLASELRQRGAGEQNMLGSIADVIDRWRAQKRADTNTYNKRS